MSEGSILGRASFTLSVRDLEEKRNTVVVLIRLGFPLIPLNPKSKRPKGNFWGDYIKRGKCPTLEEWEILLEKEPDLNIALPLGSGIIALDIDYPDCSFLPATWFRSVVIKTPQGFKVLYRVIQRDFPTFSFTYRNDGKEYGLEVHGRGRYAILPPSFIDEDGEKGAYGWLIPLIGPEDVLSEPPSDLLTYRPAQYTFKGDFLRKVQGVRAECVRVLVAEAREGMRNKACFAISALLLRHGWTPERVKNFIEPFGLALGLKNYEVKGLVRGLGKGYKLSCERVKRDFPTLITNRTCENCLVLERRLEKEMTRGKFLLRAGELLKDDLPAFFIAFTLAKYDLYQDRVFKQSFLEQETGLSEKTVQRCIKKLEDFGLIPKKVEA